MEMRHSVVDIIERRNKEEWGDFLLKKQKEGEKRPLMASGYEMVFNEKHPTNDFHRSPS